MPRYSHRSSSRSKRSAVDIATLLAEIGPLSQWLPVLETLLPTGVADTQQLQQASGLSRDQVNCLVKRFDTLAPDAILTRIQESIPRRPGRRGGSPIITSWARSAQRSCKRTVIPTRTPAAWKRARPSPTRAASSMCA